MRNPYMMLMVLALALGPLAACGAAAEPSHEALADAALETARLPGGLLVHVGCGDPGAPGLTAALGRDGRFLVRGLARGAGLAQTGARP